MTEKESATITTNTTAISSCTSSSCSSSCSSTPSAPPPAPSIKLFGTNITIAPTSKKAEEPGTLEKAQASGLACPRCKSKETKFCYFNNYNVNQPRHYCRGCQRYWTAGGALRNVPVGAGRRKGRSPPRDGPPDPLALDHQLLLFPSKRPNTGIH